MEMMTRTSRRVGRNYDDIGDGDGDGDDNDNKY